MARRGRGLDPDTRLEIALSGMAARLAHDVTPVAEAVAVLRGIGGGRTDLMAVAAGRILGGYLGEPQITNPARFLAAAYLVVAGADPALVVEHVDVVRRRVQAPRYGTR